LHYALRGSRDRLGAHIDKAAHGTARVVDSIFRERIWAPDRHRQSAIADFLDRECERIAVLDSRLLGLIGAGTATALAHFAEAVASFELARIGYYFEVQLGKMLDEKRIDIGNQRPYLRNTNVQWDRIDTDDLKSMTFLPGEEARYGVRRGDLLVCEGGDPGRCAVWSGPDGMFIQKALLRVRPYRRASVRYLLWVLRLFHSRGDFRADATGATILHLPAERLRATRIPVPPESVQHEIARRTDEVASRSRRLDAVAPLMRQRLAEYRTALVTEAVTGQLDVTAVSVAQMDERVHAAAEGAIAVDPAPGRVG
jgi:type I restriction enzyme S subunit